MKTLKGHPLSILWIILFFSPYYTIAGEQELYQEEEPAEKPATESNPATGMVYLDSCIHWAIQNLGTAHQKDLLEETARLRSKMSATSYIPQISAEGFGGWIYGLPIWGENLDRSSLAWAAKVDLEQKIWDGGETYRNRKMADIGNEISQAEIQIKERELRNKVGELYFAILLLDRQQELIDKQKSTMEEYLKMTEASIRNGVALESQANEFRISFLELEQQETELSSARTTTRKAMSLLCGRNLQNSVFVQPEFSTQYSKDPLPMENYKPEIQLLEGKSRLLDYQYGGIGQFIPQVSATAQGYFLGPETSIAQQEFNQLIWVGINLKWTLGPKIYAAGMGKRQQKIERELIEMEKDNFIRSNQIEIGNREADIEKWEKIVEKDNEIVELRQKMLADARKQFENGVLSSQKLLDAIRLEKQALSQKNIHETELMQAFFRYRQGIGY